MEIVADIKAMMRSDFCHSTSEEEFRSLQTLWRGEIQKKFVELKKMELVSKQKKNFLMDGACCLESSTVFLYNWSKNGLFYFYSQLFNNYFVHNW